MDAYEDAKARGSAWAALTGNLPDLVAIDLATLGTFKVVSAANKGTRMLIGAERAGRASVNARKYTKLTGGGGAARFGDDATTFARAGGRGPTWGMSAEAAAAVGARAAAKGESVSQSAALLARAWKSRIVTGGRHYGGTQFLQTGGIALIDDPRKWADLAGDTFYATLMGGVAGGVFRGFEAIPGTISRIGGRVKDIRVTRANLKAGRFDPRTAKIAVEKELKKLEKVQKKQAAKEAAAAARKKGGADAPGTKRDASGNVVADLDVPLDFSGFNLQSFKGLFGGSPIKTATQLVRNVQTFGGIRVERGIGRVLRKMGVDDDIASLGAMIGRAFTWGLPLITISLWIGVPLSWLGLEGLIDTAKQKIAKDVAEKLRNEDEDRRRAAIRGE